MRRALLLTAFVAAALAAASPATADDPFTTNTRVCQEGQTLVVMLPTNSFIPQSARLLVSIDGEPVGKVLRIQYFAQIHPTGEVVVFRDVPDTNQRPRATPAPSRCPTASSRSSATS